MNTNKLRSILMLFAVMLANVVVSSCHPEPEPPIPPTPEPEPAISSIGIKTPMEKKLVSVLDKDGEGDFLFYDHDYLTAFGNDWLTLLFKDNAFSGYDEDEDCSIKVFDITTNADNLISSFKMSLKDTEHEGEFEMLEEYSFTYSDRHLTKILYSYSGIDNNEEFSGDETSLFTWTNGNLTRIDIAYTGTGSEGNVFWTRDISYGRQYNKHRQYTDKLADDIIPSQVYNLALAGLFGDGPEYLPVEYSNESTYNYKLDNDGYIAEETRVYNWSKPFTFTLYYTYADEPSNVAPRTIMPGIKGDHHKPLTHKSPRARILERMNSNR